MTPDWLSQLAPEHAPPPPGWWPPAPGWWAVALLVLIALAGVAWWLRDPHRRQRRAALREIRHIKTTTTDDALAAHAIENLIRRFAVAVFGLERVAKLTGEAWLSFLVDHGGDAFVGHTGRSLLAGAFGAHAESRRDEWLSAAEMFIRRAARSRRARRGVS